MPAQAAMFLPIPECLALQLAAQTTGHPCSENKIILAAWADRHYPKSLPQEEQEHYSISVGAALALDAGLGANADFMPTLSISQ